jgi:uncharacterized protein (DUF58 family)
VSDLQAESAYASARQSARAAAQVLRLPFRGHLWRGRAGSWLGSGRGTSLEFQDHRAYVPGDDPRHINWQAYARTGLYSMKLYREEVSPSIDVVLDVSASMALTAAKAARALELLLFALDSGRAAGASVRAWTLAGGEVRPLPASSADVDSLALTTVATPGAPDLGRVPFRTGSMRVWITDALFDAPPEGLCARLVAGGGRGVALLPFAAEEPDPDWSGPLELVDCETGTVRDQRVDGGVKERYQAAYGRHFATWAEAARRFGVAAGRVPAEGGLVEALRHDAVGSGAVEPAA